MLPPALLRLCCFEGCALSASLWPFFARLRGFQPSAVPSYVCGAFGLSAGLSWPLCLLSIRGGLCCVCVLPRSCSLMRDGAASLPALCAAPYLKRYGRPFVPAGLGCGSAASACSLLLLSLLPSCCFGAPSCLSPLRPPLLLSKEIGAACLLLLCLSPPAPLLLCTAGLSPLPLSSALLWSCCAFAAPLPYHIRNRTGRPFGRPPLPSLCSICCPSWPPSWPSQLPPSLPSLSPLGLLCGPPLPAPLSWPPPTACGPLLLSPLSLCAWPLLRLRR